MQRFFEDKTPTEFVKSLRLISMIRSSKYGLEGKRKHLGRPKFNSISQTIDSNHNFGEKESSVRLEKKKHCRFFTEEHIPLKKSPSP
jgi:hypothetical protein